MNPYLATLFTFIIAIAFLRLMDFFAHRGWIDGKLSRKFIHIGTARGWNLLFRDGLCMTP